MIKYKIKHKIVNCEKIESVTSHNLYPPLLPLSQTVTLSQTPSPPWSVTYFMDGPFRDLDKTFSRGLISRSTQNRPNCLRMRDIVDWRNSLKQKNQALFSLVRSRSSGLARPVLLVRSHLPGTVRKLVHQRTKVAS